jgi:ElaB/YqjD/DUF883 family membrane-anchored ribosome-binding protein
MNENKIEGAAKVGLGKFESAIGNALGDGELQVRGGARQIDGRVQQAAGSVEEVLGQAAGRAKEAVSKATDTFARATDAAHVTARRIEDHPFSAMAIATFVGLLAGLLIAERRPRIIYVKPRD